MHKAAHAFIVGLAVFAAILSPTGAPAADTPPSSALSRELGSLALQRLLDAEARAILHRDGAALASVFDLEEASGRRALKQAENRSAFLHAWSHARGVRIEDIHMEAAIRSYKPLQDGAALRITTSEAFTYSHSMMGLAPATFGFGIRHRITLIRKGDAIKIASDRFTDPLNQDTRLIGPASPAPTAPPRPLSSEDAPPSTWHYDAEGAVRFANTYCGAAPGCGNDHLYHSGYHDYNGQGGDCTNFMSQVLKEGGGMPETGTWFYDRQHHEGSMAWANTDSLVGFLRRSDRADLVTRGHFEEVTRPSEAFSHAAIAALSPGDLVGYEENGDIVHLAVIVGKDPGGYPVVNSHTADRYHVPWDLGWDQKTRFWLIHLKRQAAPDGAGPQLLPKQKNAAPQRSGTKHTAT